MTTTRIYPYTAPISPVGGATEAKQDTQITQLTTLHTDLNTTIHGDLVTLNAKVPVLGQALMAASTPVVIASNQTALPLKAQDGAGNALTSQVNGAARALDVGVNVAGVQVDPRAIRALTSSDVVSVATLTVVDQIDTTPLLNAASTNIPASASNSLSIVASLAAAVKKVVSVDDLGEFLGLYSGPVATPTLLCILPLGGGEIEVAIPAGTLVSIRNMQNSAITSGYLAINFLG